MVALIRTGSSAVLKRAQAHSALPVTQAEHGAAILDARISCFLRSSGPAAFDLPASSLHFSVRRAPQSHDRRHCTVRLVTSRGSIQLRVSGSTVPPEQLVKRTLPAW